MDGAGTGRVWFITGASSGLGRQLAEAALDWDDRVVMTARDVASLHHFERANPGRVLATKLDVTQPGQAGAATSW